jgi:hypothetical protein
MQVSDQLHTPATLTLRKGPQNPLERRLGGCYGENFLSLLRIESQILRHPAHSLNWYTNLAILTPVFKRENSF